MRDLVLRCISIPPKYAVANVVGYLKDKSAIQIARKHGARQRNFTGEHFCACGSVVLTLGFDMDVVRAYNCYEKEEDERYGQSMVISE